MATPEAGEGVAPSPSLLLPLGLMCPIRPGLLWTQAGPSPEQLESWGRS